MIKKIVFLSLFLFGLKSTLLAQVNVNPQLQITWQSCFGTPYDDGATLCPAYGGGYMMLSSTMDYFIDTLPGGFGRDDLILRRIDASGQIIWQKYIGGSDQDWAGFIMPDGLGNYYMSATTYSNDHDIQSANHGDADAWIVKIDSSGNIIWERCFGGSRYEDWCVMQMMSNGNILAWTMSFSSDGDLPAHYGCSDAWIFILTPSGEIVESKVFGNAHNNGIGKVIETKDGGFFTVSTGVEGGMVSAPGHHGDFDAWALKLDKHLNIEWQKVYGGSCEDKGYTCILETHSGYLFFAYTTSNDGDVTGYNGTPCEVVDANTWMVRIDTLGNLIWQKSLGIGVASVVFPTISGGFVLFGDKTALGCSNYLNQEIFIKEIDSLGSTLWENSYGSYANDGFGKVIERGPYDWLVPAVGEPSCDMQCEGFGWQDIWLFNLKDCNLYKPHPTDMPLGPHVVCTSLTPQSNYYVHAAALAQAYEWSIFPNEAGTIVYQDTSLIITWAAGFEGTVSVLARSINDCGMSDWSKAFYADVHTCTGIADENGLGIAVWPNPANNILNFKFNGNLPSTPTSIEVYDLFGRKIAVLPVASNQARWDCSAVSVGMYIYKLNSNNQVFKGRLTINR